MNKPMHSNSSSSASRKSPSSDNLMNLMQKLSSGKQPTNMIEKEHFSSLLEKIVPTLASSDATSGKSSDDVMKWFRNAVAAAAASGSSLSSSTANNQRL